jgi:hypothetical protein
MRLVHFTVSEGALIMIITRDGYISEDKSDIGYIRGITAKDMNFPSAAVLERQRDT